MPHSRFGGPTFTTPGCRHQVPTTAAADPGLASPLEIPPNPVSGQLKSGIARVGDLFAKLAIFGTPKHENKRSLLNGSVLPGHGLDPPGMGVAEKRTFRVPVVDGLLDIDLIPHQGVSTVSALEIERLD